MSKYLVAVSLLAFSAGMAAAPIAPGDSKRGAELFQTLHCSNCHRAGSVGAATGPDLAKVIDRGYTPSSMASRMWNHAPSMWASVEEQKVSMPALTESQAGDLFAYFHSLRFFERPGDAARGKRVFTSSHCAECHDRTSRSAAGAPPISSWNSLTSPIVLAQQMWNHADRMESMMASRKIKWPRLTGQEFTDLLVYLRNLPETRGRVIEFSLASTSRGASLFQEKGCQSCHQGKLALEKRMAAGTLTDFALAMWNHAPDMAESSRRSGQPMPKLEAAEMGEIVAFLWTNILYAEAGDAAKGLRVFEKKNCSSCHSGSNGSGPDLKQLVKDRSGPIRPFSMISVLWLHGPTMLAQMKSKQMAWPVFSQSEMSDMIAYLNSIK